eukprot:CAMPEP_0198221140 /NCGR_PEP_ID=MMETSP1445-20131203/82346_1 /TAXON_ID=36898 /ORGANISM="Pyramimonas sp., Strain CCMP2087" /LENGTH=93 /DNA_ID=CAMNT_0043899161 /DNA_START=305 /DNA_END=587 /DNA_ORIENTATION=-
MFSWHLAWYYITGLRLTPFEVLVRRQRDELIDDLGEGGDVFAVPHGPVVGGQGKHDSDPRERGAAVRPVELVQQETAEYARYDPGPLYGEQLA